MPPATRAAADRSGSASTAATPAASTWLLKGDAFHSRDDLPDRPAGEFTELDLQGRWSMPVGGSRVDVQSYYRREYRRVPQQLTHHIDVFDLDAQHDGHARRRATTWSGAAASASTGTRRTRAPPCRSDPAEPRLPRLQRLRAGRHRRRPRTVLRHRRRQVRAQRLQRRRVPAERPRALSHAAQPDRLGRRLARGAPSDAVRRRHRRQRAGRHRCSPWASDDFQAESLVGGGNRLPHPAVAAVLVDATVFTHHISDLRSQELPRTGLPIVVGNTLEGDVRGVEVGVNVAAGHLVAHPRRLHVARIRRFDARPGSRDIGGGATEANDPDQFVGLRRSFDLPHRIEVDAMLRAVAALPNPAVPSYTELNLRVGWWATARCRAVDRRTGSAPRPPP